ncbi:MAG: sarcosine oxidase subunit delta [bacterium]|nr:sarcosine oxidase subunit delta [bacterium]
MLLIFCPHCGPRNADEFSFRGELVPRPGPDPSSESWRAYLYTKENLAGWEREQWFHVSGCRRFLDVERNTITNEIRLVRDVAGGTV